MAAPSAGNGTDSVSMVSMTMTNSSGAAPTGTSGGGGGESAAMSNQGKHSKIVWEVVSYVAVDTFLRGGYATNAEGIVEFTTFYPGYCKYPHAIPASTSTDLGYMLDTGRTIHIHTMVHTNYSVATNGSIISHAGQVRHIGQIFFDDTLNDEITTQGVYANTTQTRQYNVDDGILDSENADGYNAYASWVAIFGSCGCLWAYISL
jgi:hypothetical protein